MQQIHCFECGRQWSTAVDKEQGFEDIAGGRTHVSVLALLQGFALIVLGVPMSRMELLVRIKAETVKKKLLLLLRRRSWEGLRQILEERFKLPASYLTEFDCVIVLAAERGRPSFLDWSKQLRRQGGADRAACARLASRIMGRDVKVREIASRN